MMKLSNFTPKISPSYKSIKAYSIYKESRPISMAADFLKDVLVGKKKAIYQQTAWMGRGCFKKIAKHSYIIGKGIGPGPGSEQMRQLLDRIWMNRTKNKLGGCIRINSGTYYPLLLQYQKKKNVCNVIDPRPEGFSIFGALAREAEAGEIYKKIGVDIVAPVYLLRNSTSPPWKKTNNKTGLTSFIQKKFPAVFKEKYGIFLTEKVVITEMEESGYWELDGGVLVRHAKTPYRIVNLHFALIDKDKKTLEYLTRHARIILKEAVPVTGLKQKREIDILLVKKLGEAAGKLFSHGVIHGQLNIHYQNVSIAGEFSDFDSSVFLNNYPSLIKNVPMPKLEKSILTAHNNFTKSISKIEKKYNIAIQKFIDCDVNKYTKSKKLGLINKELLAMYMLGQIYDIYNHAIKVYDLLGRATRKKFAKKGTILTKYEMVTVRIKFMESLIVEIKKNKASTLLFWAIEHGIKSFLSTYVNKKGETTIYGWEKKTTPLNHLLKRCDSSRNKFIREDGRAFLKQLQNIFNQ